MSRATCSNCGGDVVAKGLCSSCYRYSRRHAGKTRPLDVRPEVTEAATLRLDPKLRAHIGAAAKRAGLPVARWIREACAEKLRRDEAMRWLG